MDMFEEEEMKKRPVKSTWHDWLISYIPKPRRKSVSVLKDRSISLFQTSTSKQAVYGRGQKLRKPRKPNIKKAFTSEKNKEKVKDRIIRDIWKLFETEEEEEKKEKNKKKRKNIMKE